MLGAAPTLASQAYFLIATVNIRCLYATGADSKGMAAPGPGWTTLPAPSGRGGVISDGEEQV